MKKIVLLRHGESTWNKENRFTGWKDVDLTERASRRRARPARLLTEEGFDFDVAFTSVLKRAIRTLGLALEEMDRLWLPVEQGLAPERAPLRRAAGPEQGRDGGEVRRAAGAASGGAATTCRRRRSMPATRATRRATAATRGSPQGELPLTECLKDTVARVLPYWNERIAPRVAAGERVLIAAHGNSLRALVKYLDGMSRRGDRRAEHPDRHPAGLRAGRRAEADPQLLPRRRRTRSRRRSTRSPRQGKAR